MNEENSVFGMICRIGAGIVVAGNKGMGKIKAFLESDRAKNFFKEVEVKGAEFEKLGREKATKLQADIEKLVKEAGAKLDSMADQSAQSIDDVCDDLLKRVEELRRKAKENDSKQ